MSSNVRDELQSSLGSAYSLDRELGGGGMSRVFLAEETRLRRKVVVKVLAPELGLGINAERFEREIQLAASLQQANIVPVLSAGELRGLPYFTMPYVEGESLRARLGRVGALPVSDVSGIVRDVARALAYAHERGVVHRDIKPDNVLLSGGTAVVTDFGIAKAISASREPSAGSTLTQLGTSLGTPAYMAPEQAAGDPDIDHRADIYALGCTAYELLAGHSPFHDHSPQRMLAAHLTEQPRPISEVRPDTPAPLAELVMRCLAKDPAERPQSASELVQKLESVMPSGSHAAMSMALLGSPRTLWRAVVLYAVSFIAVAVIARAAVIALGLPDWAFVGALLVMALGLPVIALTGYAHHAARQVASGTPVLTPGGSPGRSGIAALAARAGRRVTWRRVAFGGAATLVAFAVLVGAFMLARSLGIGPAGSLLAAGKLSGQDRLLVADFRVNGADSSIGHIASEAVRIELAQSEAVSVVPANAVAASLQRMRRPPSTRVDATLAREIAAREGIKAILNGDITPFGGGFVVTMRLIASQSGEELAAFRETADSPSELIPTLEELSRRLRGKIGESLKSVRASPALLDVTTTSLEALRKYAMATRVMDLERKFPEAITLLEEAVSLDTSFAMAHRKLGVAYRSYGYPEKGDSALARAFRHRDRLTDQERLLTVATYYSMGPGRDRQRGIAAYEELLAIDPENSGALNNVGLLYRQRREFDKAEDVYRRAVALDDATLPAYTNLRVTLFHQGNVAAVESVTAAQQRRFPGVWSEPLDHVPLLYHRGELDSLGVLLRGLVTSTNPAVRNSALSLLVEYEALHGRLRESRRMFAELRAAAIARGIELPDLLDSLTVARDFILHLGQIDRGVKLVDHAMRSPNLEKMEPDQRPYFFGAMLYAMAGRPDRAKMVLARYDAGVRDSSLRRQLEPSRHAVLGAIALGERRGPEALAELRLADRYPDGPANECAICTDPLIGMAYEVGQMPDSAIATYEHYLTTPTWGRFSTRLDGTWLPFISRRLAELYEAKGDRARASAYLTKFINLWTNADRDLQPQVEEAKARLDRLRDVEPRRGSQ